LKHWASDERLREERRRKLGRHSAPDEGEGREVRTVVPVGYDRPQPGRHSRPDDDDDAPPSIVLEAVRPTPPPPGEVLADQLTEPIAAEPEAPEAPAPEAAPREPEASEQAPPASDSTELAIPGTKELVPVGRGNQATSADLALLREHSEVRNRVIAAVVAPFVLYTVIMYLIDAVNVYFIWVWIPLVTAGIVGGSILDAAHRRRAKDAD
jgi:hypothetical protein